jgi:hypothetical protein
MSNFFHEFDALIMASVVMGGMFQNRWGYQVDYIHPYCNTSTFKVLNLNGRPRNDAMQCFIE